MKAPDLRPSLTTDEVEKSLQPWKAIVENFIQQQQTPKEDAELQRDLDEMQREVAAKIPKGKKLTLFSLFPTPTKNLPTRSAFSPAMLAKLPTFHDYPILGSFTLDSAEEIQAWTSFLRIQTMPGPMTLCGFYPRHGLSVVGEDGKAFDILVCFQCAQLQFVGINLPNLEYPPTFSPAVKAVMDRLFEKKGVLQDSEKEE